MFTVKYLIEILIKIALATVIGLLIGHERARRGKDAGIRTHILVAVGAAMTSMTSLFVFNCLNVEGDVFRISAQVISGIGFLGAGMIILRNNNAIANLTTAAGIWVTGSIGVAVGYGFYTGALIVTAFTLIAIVITRHLEKRKNEISYYIEIDDMSELNNVIDYLKSVLGENLNYSVLKAISDNSNHLGISFAANKDIDIKALKLESHENILFICEE